MAQGTVQPAQHPGQNGAAGRGRVKLDVLKAIGDFRDPAGEANAPFDLVDVENIDGKYAALQNGGVRIQLAAHANQDLRRIQAQACQRACRNADVPFAAAGGYYGNTGRPVRQRILKILYIHAHTMLLR